MPNLDSLINEFFLINNQPSDDQVHKLAYALGIDKETLEAVIYRLFGSEVEPTGLQARINASSEDELALQGEIPVDKMDDRQATFNDGLLIDEAPSDQQLLLNDGSVPLLIDPNSEM